MMMVRREHRPDDTWLIKTLAGVVRWRGVALIVVTSLATAGGLAYKFTPRLEAIERRQTMTELHMTMIDSKQDSAGATSRLLVRIACFNMTKADQEFVTAPCPANIFRGAKRTSP